MPPIRPVVYYFNISLRWWRAGISDVIKGTGFRGDIVGEHTLWLNNDKEPYEIHIYDSAREEYPFMLKTRYAPVFVRPLLVNLVKTKMRNAGFMADRSEINVEMQKVVAAEQFGRV